MSEKIENVWQILYTHESEIYGYIKSSIGDGEIARDLYQDVYLSAIQNLDKLDTERSLKNWLYTVTRNRVINYLKSKHRKETIELSDHQSMHMPADHLDTHLIQRVFLKMNPLHRRVLLWHLHDGYSYEEISEKLDRSISAVSSLIHRARENFQKIYLLELLPAKLGNIPGFQDIMRFIDPLDPAYDLFERVERRALEYFSVLNRQWDKIRTEFLNENDLLEVLGKIILPPAARIADLGSGTGFVSLACATKGYRVFGLDKNRVMTTQLMESREDLSIGNLHLVQADIKSLPLQKNSMNALFFTLVLHHLADPMAVLISSLKSVMPDGYIVLIDFLRHYEKDLADTMHDLWLGFEPGVIEKQMKRNGADLVVSGVIRGKSPIQSFYQIFRKVSL